VVVRGIAKTIGMLKRTTFSKLDILLCHRVKVGLMVVGGCCRWSQVDAHNEVGWIAGEGAKRA
jgi:hypothetical protein